MLSSVIATPLPPIFWFPPPNIFDKPTPVLINVKCSNLIRYSQIRIMSSHNIPLTLCTVDVSSISIGLLMTCTYVGLYDEDNGATNNDHRHSPIISILMT